MYAKVCPDCGCYLDPGEKCDCRQLREAEKELKRRENEDIRKMLAVEANGQLRMAV